MSITAIETTYAGCRFRSRLEARWAVLFDALGVAWQYELQGFRLTPIDHDAADGYCDHCFVDGSDRDLGAYLPDFWLPNQNAWFEVKGAEPAEPEWDRLFRFILLARRAGQRAFVAVGDIPDPSTIDDSGHPYDGGFDIHVAGDQHHCWTTCHLCGFPDIQFDARSARAVCGCHKRADVPCRDSDKCYHGHDPKILAAYAAARSARFEHGERR